MQNTAMLWVSAMRRKIGFWRARYRRPTITTPTGKLPLGTAPYTFVSVVSPLFNQNIPLATSLARVGYCHGFEQIGSHGGRTQGVHHDHPGRRDDDAGVGDEVAVLLCAEGGLTLDEPDVGCDRLQRQGRCPCAVCGQQP